MAATPFGSEFIVADEADVRASFADASVSGYVYLAFIAYQRNHLVIIGQL